jgi:transposase InsO family protein
VCFGFLRWRPVRLIAKTLNVKANRRWKSADWHTSAAFAGVLIEAPSRISMDARGRWMGNVFIERVWRSLKHEDVYLRGYADGRE